MNAQRIAGGTVHKLPSDFRKAVESNATAKSLWVDITPLARNEYLKILSSTTEELVVEISSLTKEIVTASPEMKQEQILLRLDQLLHPEFELRQFRPFDGDSYSIYIAASSTWSSLERTDPTALEKYFLSMPRLAAFWKKGYLARLFSKP